jgi:hypothetical protein
MLRPPQISANRGLAPRRTRRIPREPGRLWPELARGFPLGKPPPGRRFLAGLGGARTKSPREDLSAPKACPAQHPKGPAGTASALPGTCEEVRGPSPPLSSWHLGMFDLVRPSPSSQISGRHVLVPPHAPRVARPPQRLCPKPARIFPSANAFLGPQVLRHLPAARAVPREKDLCEPRACPAQHPKGPAGTGKALAGACEELPFGKASLGCLTLWFHGAADNVSSRENPSVAKVCPGAYPRNFLAAAQGWCIAAPVWCGALHHTDQLIRVLMFSRGPVQRRP